MNINKSHSRQFKLSMEPLDERIVPATFHPHAAAAVGHVVALGGGTSPVFTGPGNNYGLRGTGATTQVSRAFRGGTTPVFTGPGNNYGVTGTGATTQVSRTVSRTTTTPTNSPFPGPGNNYGVRLSGGVYQVSRSTPRFRGGSFSGRYSPYINVPAAVSSNPFFPAAPTSSPSYVGSTSFTPTGTLPTYSATGGFYNGGPMTTITVPVGTAINF